jgi:hypothetical protein
MLADKAIGMETRIPGIWVSNLSNFVKYRSLEALDLPVKAGWQRGKDNPKCTYLRMQSGSLDALKASPEFPELIRVHSRLLPAAGI